MNRLAIVLLAVVAGVPTAARADYEYFTAREMGYGWSPLHVTDPGFQGDEVDLYNGALWVTSTDVFLPGPRGLDLVLTRSYSSQRARADDYVDAHTGYAEQTGWLGRGWKLTAGYAYTLSGTIGGDRFVSKAYFSADGVSGARALGSTMGFSTWTPSWNPGDTPLIVGLPVPNGLYNQDPLQPETVLLEDGSWMYFTPTGLAVMTRDGLVYSFDQVNDHIEWFIDVGNADHQAWQVTEIRNRFGDTVTVSYGADDQITGLDASWLPGSPDVTVSSSGGVLQSVTWPGPMGMLTRNYQVDTLQVGNVMTMPSTVPYTDCAELPSTSSATVTVLDVVDHPDGTSTDYDYQVEVLPGREIMDMIFPTTSAPQPSPLHYVALTQIEGPTGLVSGFTYETETFLRGVRTTCCSNFSGDPSIPFAYRTRLAVASRQLTIGTQSLTWSFSRPASVDASLVMADDCPFPDETWFSVPEADDLREVAVTGPYGIVTTYGFEQLDADWSFGNQGATVAACAATDGTTCFSTPPTTAVFPQRQGQLETLTVEDGGTEVRSEELVWTLWQPVSVNRSVPQLLSRTVYLDGQVAPSLVQTWDPPDSYGRQPGADTLVTTPGGGAELSTSLLSFEPVVPASLADWNLVDLPILEQSWLSSAPTSDVEYVWGTSGSVLGRVEVETRFLSGAGGQDLESAFAYSDDLSAGETTVTTTFPAGTLPTAVELVGPAGLLSLQVGGDTLVTNVYASSGHPLSSVDERGLEETWFYDSTTGQVLNNSVTSGSRILRSDTYDWSGWPLNVGVTDELGLTTLTFFDPLGRTTALTRPTNSMPLGSAPATTAIGWTYDDIAQTTTSLGPAGFLGVRQEQVVTRDDQGRPVSLATSSPQVGDATVAWPNSTEAVATRTAGSSRSMAASMAADGSLRGLVDAANEECAQWTPLADTPSPGLSGQQAGSFLRVGACSPTAPGQRTTAVSVDASGVAAGGADTGRGYTEASVDGAGRPDSVGTADGSYGVGYESDRGRVETVSKGAQTVTITYGTAGAEKGLPESLETENGNAVTFGYAGGGLLDSVQWDEDYSDTGTNLYPSDLQGSSTFSYVLDTNGLVSAIVYSDGSKANYTYDAHGRVDNISFQPMDATTGVLGAAQPLVTATSWSHWDTPQHRQYANGLEEDWTIDGVGRYLAGEISGIPDLIEDETASRSTSSYTVALNWTDHLLSSVTRGLPDGASESSIWTHDSRDRPTGVTNVAGSNWSWSWNTVDDVTDRGTGGTNEALELSSQSWIGNRPDGGEYTLDSNTGRLTEAAGYTFLFDDWGRAIYAQGTVSGGDDDDSAGTGTSRDVDPTAGVELAFGYNGLGLLGLEYRIDSNQGRWLKYGPGGELLEEWSWVPTDPLDPLVGDWELNRRFILDPTTGQMVAVWHGTAGQAAAPECPQTVTVTEQSDYMQLSWTPVLGASSYAIYRDGQIHKYLSANEPPTLRDFELTENTTYTYEVRPRSATGQEPQLCGSDLATFGEPDLDLLWNPATDPDVVGYFIEGCLDQFWDQASSTCAASQPLSNPGVLIPVGSETWTFDLSTQYAAGQRWWLTVFAVDSAQNVSAASTPYDTWSLANGTTTPPATGLGAQLVVVITDATGQDTLVVDAAAGTPAYYGMMRRAPDGSMLLGSPVATQLEWDPVVIRALALAPNLLTTAAGPVAEATQEPINGLAALGTGVVTLGTGIGLGGLLIYGGSIAFSISNPVGWAFAGTTLFLGGGSIWAHRMGEGYDAGISAPGRAAALAAADMTGVPSVYEGLSRKSLMTGAKLSGDESGIRLGLGFGVIGTIGTVGWVSSSLRSLSADIGVTVARAVTEGATEAVGALARGAVQFHGPPSPGQLYAQLVNSNRAWKWSRDFGPLTRRRRAAARAEARSRGLIPTVEMKPGTMYADFAGAGLVRNVRMLPRHLWDASDTVQFGWLDAQVLGGGRPFGHTWHHTEIPGRMELVPLGIHNVIAHYGGRSQGHWSHAPR